MISPAREAAYRVVHSVFSDRTDLPAALADVHATLADERDQALANEIALGTVRWRAALDYLIEHVARRPLDRFDSEILDVLRLSVYQLLHLDRVPAAAVVDEAVKLAGWVKKRSAAGLVNAVLREVARNRHRLPLPTRQAELDYLSITLSQPRWLAARWLARYGFQVSETWARFFNTPAPLTVRANTLRVSPDELINALAAEDVEVRPTRYAPHGLVTLRGNPIRTSLAGTGLFVPQDEASQLVAAFAAATPGELVLDACASPGGKTTALAASIDDRGLVVAADLRLNRVRLLRETVTISGANSIRIVRLDLERAVPFRPSFDCVLVDAPCSGLGAIRRDPDIKWRRESPDLATFASAQRAMLGHAAEAVRPGGRLIYSTCSSEPEENEEVVDAFLATHPDFERRRPAETGVTIPAGVEEVLDDRGYLRTSPHLHGLEAFFAAMLVRRRHR